MTIEEYVPKLQNSIDNVGFLFGAGTSYESGYPLVAGLTKMVVGALHSDERETLDEVLDGFGLTYEAAQGIPNIEEISDLVIEQYTNSQADRFGLLKERIRVLVHDAILGIQSPDISNQIAFFERIKARSYDRPTDVWIFTTNYDLLFENACAQVGLKLVNGFVGATTRFFSERDFSLVSGTVAGSRFAQESGLTIRLVKLHGSVSWFRKQEKVFEAAPEAIQTADVRCMILPRRTKVLETLAMPYDRLFRLSSSVLGDRCKHLISSGFSFADSHINDDLIVPKIGSGAISFTNFCEEEPNTLISSRNRPNVRHICKNKVVTGGVDAVQQSNAWQFGEFVKLF